MITIKRIVAYLLVVTLFVSVCCMPGFASSHPFVDVDSESWYEEYVDYCYVNNLMKGMSATTFGPELTMSRAMVVTVLYRIAGEPTALNSIPFEDVEDDTWYTDAVKWAYHTNVVNGTSAITFSPNKNVTREQLVTMIFRYATYSHDSCVGTSGSLANYSDTEAISSYAKSAFKWAVAVGVIHGVTNTKLQPRGSATRAQCAAILQRYDILRDKGDIPIADVSFTQDEYIVNKGTVVEIETILDPANATETLMWTSSDDNVATVENGYVTAVGSGTAIIQAIAPNGDNAACIITVITPVEGVTLEQSTYTVCRGGSVAIVANVFPADASIKRIKWSSSDESIARVVNGTVYGVSTGTAIITVTTEDGNFSSNCSVTVIDAPITLKCRLTYTSFIEDPILYFAEGLHAAVEINGGSGNYSEYTINISIYHEDGRMVASESNVEGNRFNSGWIATLEVTLSEIMGSNKMNPNLYKGTYTAVFEIIDDEGNSHSGTATYLWS